MLAWWRVCTARGRRGPRAVRSGKENTAAGSGLPGARSQEDCESRRKKRREKTDGTARQRNGSECLTYRALPADSRDRTTGWRRGTTLPCTTNGQNGIRSPSRSDWHAQSTDDTVGRWKLRLRSGVWDAGEGKPSVLASHQKKGDGDAYRPDAWTGEVWATEEIWGVRASCGSIEGTSQCVPASGNNEACGGCTTRQG